MAVKLHGLGVVLKMSAMGRASASFRFIGGRPRTSSMVRTKSMVLYCVEMTRALLHVGARHEGDAAVRIDVVAAILRVVFHHKDQGVIRVLAVGDLLNQQADRIVVIGYLSSGVFTPSIAVSKFPV